MAAYSQNRTEVAIGPSPKFTSHAEAHTGPNRHTDAEWIAVYPYIKRMYVGERHQVRYIIDKLEREHNFKVRLVAQHSLSVIQVSVNIGLRRN